MYFVRTLITTIAYGTAAFSFPLTPPTRDVATCTLVLLPVATVLPPATDLQVEVHFGRLHFQALNFWIKAQL